MFISIKLLLLEKTKKMEWSCDETTPFFIVSLLSTHDNLLSLKLSKVIPSDNIR